jgi:hypothetical protein
MDMTPLDCPACGRTNSPFGVLNTEQQYRCAGCGMVYYGPVECADTIEGATAGQQKGDAAGAAATGLPEDWQTEAPARAE